MSPSVPAEKREKLLRGQRILVTGAGGFIGSRVVALLVRSGASVTTIDRNDREDEGVARAICADLCERKDVDPLLRNEEFDVCIHLAAPGRENLDISTMADEVRMVAPFLDAAADGRIRHLICFGSADQYGETTPPQDEETNLQPHNSNGLSKTLMQMCLASYREWTDAEVTLLRPFLVYGHGMDRSMFLAQLIRAALGDRPLEMSKGRQRRDFVHVSDVAEAVLSAIRRDVDGQEEWIFNVGTGRGTSLLEVVVLLEEVLGRRIEMRRGRYSRGRDPDALVADVRRAATTLSWRAEVEFEEGLSTTVQAYRRDLE